MLKIYNTLSRKIESFKPLHNKNVGLYTCGPTVYDFAHIGNLRTYIFEDILRRTLEFNGYKVKHVMNITDVGHLTSDADSGEDKLEKGAKREKKSVWDIVKFYTKSFLDDIKKLNIKKADFLIPATKTIKEQIAIIKKLFEEGFAYETKSAIYFNVSKFKNYTKLSRQKLSQKIIGARKEVFVDDKKTNPQDFVLWFKLIGHFKNHTMQWPSPWGKGFPGWHIECSAIATKYLGQPFDIHTGGIDHINIHHTNEIAQSEAAYKKPLAKYWLHGEFLLIDKNKMAKSQGNFFTLKDIENKKINPLAFRYLILNSHYRSKLNFTWKSLEAAQNALNNLYNDVSTLKNFKGIKNETTKYNAEFIEAINDDLNTPRALSILWKVIKEKTLSAKSKKQLINEFDKVLGLGLNKVKTAKMPAKILELAQKREKLRVNQQFIKADALRKKIESLGYMVEDTANGPRVLRKS